MAAAAATRRWWWRVGAFDVCVAGGGQGGGGGGFSHAAVSGAAFSTGAQSGNGRVTISYAAPTGVDHHAG